MHVCVQSRGITSCDSHCGVIFIFVGEMRISDWSETPKKRGFEEWPSLLRD